MNIVELILNNLINFLGGKDNALVVAAILSFIATLFLVLITKRYVSLTKEISMTNLKALNLNEETEKRKLTLTIINDFDRNRFSKLHDNLLKLYQENNIEFENLEQSRIMHFKDENQLRIAPTPEIVKEVDFFINYFDTISILYLNKKLDEDLFKKKILDSCFLVFIINYCDTINKRLNIYKKYVGEVINWQQDFLIVSVKILRDYIKSNIDEKVKDIFEYALSYYEDLLSRNNVK